MDDALIQDDGVDLIVAELNRCWEVTQDQETTFMSYVARRKLNFQQLENVVWTPLPTVIKGYATLREAKL